MAALILGGAAGTFSGATVILAGGTLFAGMLVFSFLTFGIGLFALRRPVPVRKG